MTAFVLSCFFSFPFSVRGSWVDPDTPLEKRSIQSLNVDDDREYELVRGMGGVLTLHACVSLT